MAVLPARAGVIPVQALPAGTSKGFTRTRGGDPVGLFEFVVVVVFYPHARG